MKILLGSILLLLCLYLFAKPVLGKKKNAVQKNYPKLGIDSITSEHFELVKVAELGPNNITDNVWFLSKNQTFIFKAGICSYFKLSNTGDLIDTFYGMHQMHEVGVFFHDDYYIDWAFSGDTNKKPYKEYIDGATLSKAQFEQYVKRAELVLYDSRFVYDPDQSFIRCLLKIETDWMLIECLVPESDKDWQVNFIEAAKTKYLYGDYSKDINALTPIDNTIIPFYDWKDEMNPIYIESHNRRVRIKKPFFSYDINNQARKNGWESTGYFKVKVNSEFFNFQAYTYEQVGDFTSFNPQMSLYSCGALPNLHLLLVEEGRGDRPASEVGLYALRKR